ncbi:MAG TPA: hypothetical protein VM283_03015, partial [Armatimonadota bacterium]|nr:hypothetical protein [Armatimonadota bacterium]
SGEKQGALAFTGGPQGLAGRTIEGFKVYASVKPAAGAQVLAAVDGTPAVIAHDLGRGRVIFLAGEFGVGLPANHDNERKGREERVWPSELSAGHVAVWSALLDDMYGGPVSLLREAPEGKDVEVAAMRNGAGQVLLLAANWEREPLSCRVALPEGAGAGAQGYRIGPDGAVSEATARAQQAGGGQVLSLDLAGQEAVLLRLQ